MSSDLHVDYPENQGISSRSILDFVNLIETLELGVNSFVLLRNGRKIAEFYRQPYRKDCPQLLFSLTKMFTSAAVGIALDGGVFSLNDQAISFFPDKLPETITPNLEKLTIHHLLSMNTGHRDHNYHKIYPQRDWVKGFLAIPPEHEPGTHYCYSTHASFVLSAIVERTTGQNLVDFLMPRLFDPLDISRPTWETGPLGITAGGMGLNIPTEAVAKFGQMLLDRGVYSGQRILSEEYIRLATMKHSETSDSRDTDDRQGYGYHIQLCRHGCFRHVGSFGQVCFVSPRDRVVVAATSGKRNFQEMSDLIYEYILNRIEESTALYSNDYNRLQRRLDSMTPLLPEYVPAPDGIPDLTSRGYSIDDNPDGIERLCLSLCGDSLQWKLIYRNNEAKTLTFGFSKPTHAYDVFIKDISLHEQEVVMYARWQDERTLKLTMVYIETPYVATYLLSFDGQDIMLSFGMNVSLGNFSPLTRRGYRTSGKMIPYTDHYITV